MIGALIKTRRRFEAETQKGRPRECRVRDWGFIATN